MKILLLSNKSPWPPKDGGSSATWSLIKTLIENNISITLLSFNTSRHKSDVSEIPEIYRNKIEAIFIPLETAINPFKLIANLLFSRQPYNLERFISRNFENSLLKVLENNFDLIQIEGLAMAYYIPFIKSHSSAKVVFRAHNIENQIWTQLASEENNPFKKIYFRILSARIRRIETTKLKQADGLIGFTNQDAQWFQSSYPSIPCLVNPPAIKPQINETVNTEAGTLFFIGALDWRPNIKGLTWFLNNVWPIILKNKPGTLFHIAGRNPSKRVADKLCGPNIIFHGEIESSEEFISSKSVMVVPLFSGSGIRMKILEGMSLRRSIVATPLAASGLIFEDKKNIFLASDPGSFAGLVLDLLNDADKRTRTGIFAYENVRQNYDIFAATKELLKFYSELA